MVEQYNINRTTRVLSTPCNVHIIYGIFENFYLFLRLDLKARLQTNVYTIYIRNIKTFKYL